MSLQLQSPPRMEERWKMDNNRMRRVTDESTHCKQICRCRRHAPFNSGKQGEAHTKVQTPNMWLPCGQFSYDVGKLQGWPKSWSPGSVNMRRKKCVLRTACCRTVTLTQLSAFFQTLLHRFASLANIMPKSLGRPLSAYLPKSTHFTGKLCRVPERFPDMC